MEPGPSDAPFAPAAPSPPPPARNRWPRRAAWLAEALVVVFAAGLLGLRCSIPATAPLADHNPATTAFIDLRRDQAAAAGKPFNLRWQWRPLSAISRFLRAAAIDAEDYDFYRHDGVDWKATEHAIHADWNRGAMAIGGSTITQQLAKNLYLSPSRNPLRKLREIFIAFSLEDHLTKSRILELYLNIVEWGDGIFGAEAASRAWFHHSAAQLSPAEAIRLAIALPNPITRAPNVRDPELTKKGIRIVRLFRMQGLINAAEERTTLDQLGASSEGVLPDREISEHRAEAASELPPEPSTTAQPPAGSPSEQKADKSHGTDTTATGSPAVEKPTSAPSASDTPATSRPAANSPEVDKPPHQPSDSEPSRPANEPAKSDASALDQPAPSRPALESPDAISTPIAPSTN